MSEFIMQTEHLNLRLIDKKDESLLQTLDTDSEVKEYFPSGTLDTKEINELITECISQYKAKGLPCFVFFERDSDEFVGRSHFGLLETGEIKVGYLLRKKFWDQGYATEVLTVLLDWAKNNIAADYIVAYADKENTPSFAVMKKCKMTYYKSATYLGMDCDFYRISNQ